MKRNGRSDTSSITTLDWRRSAIDNGNERMGEGRVISLRQSSRALLNIIHKQ